MNINEILKSAITLVLGGFIGGFIKEYFQNKTEKKNKIEKLISENEQLKKTIEKYENLKEKEQNIDKSKGSIYLEKIADSDGRYICGYCWEESKKTIPIIPDFTDEHVYYYGVVCEICKKGCYFGQHSQEEQYDDEEPF